MKFNYLIFIFLDFYLSLFCLNDSFFDIVFNLKIDNSSYNFMKEEYNENWKKNIWKILFIFFNGFIILSCIYVFIFILIPIVYFRIGQCLNKETRVTEFKSRLGSNNLSLLKERFTSDA